MTDRASARAVAAVALESIGRHRVRINALNVYPVPDGDTGTNLEQTVSGIVDALERSSATTAAGLAAEAQRAATKAAKGNSGVILSTIVRGMAPVVGSARRVDAGVLAEALRAGATSAYDTVQPPVEGTILTVIREMAEEAEQPEVGDLPLTDALRRVVARGEDAVERTPEMLDRLREAGVVDAGGAGLVELARGVLHGLTGEPLPEVPDVVGELTEESIHQEESLYRFCTSFVVEGEGLDLAALHAALEPFGDSLLVTGDTSIAKVHVHTDLPERILDVRRAAENAAAESTKDVRVIATSSMPEGTVAAFEFDPASDIDANEMRMRSAIGSLAVGEITRASRDATVDGVAVREGAFLGMLDGKALAADDDLWIVLDALLGRFAADGRSLVQVLCGEDAPDAVELEERIEARGLEPEVRWGGQPHYPLLLSAD
jgi:dihydroxyacetone kinase-like predicted kinase